MELKEKIRFIADYYGLGNQLDKTKEELQELGKALQDYYFYFPLPFDDVQSDCTDEVVEELADMEIMGAQLAYLLEREDAVKATVKYKLDRQMERIKEEQEEKAKEQEEKARQEEVKRQEKEIQAWEAKQKKF